MSNAYAFKKVYFMGCKLHLNKAIKKRNRTREKFLQESRREETVTWTEVAEMERSKWIGGLCVLALELLKLGGGMDRDSGGKRCL